MHRRLLCRIAQSQRCSLPYKASDTASIKRYAVGRANAEVLPDQLLYVAADARASAAPSASQTFLMAAASNASTTLLVFSLIISSARCACSGKASAAGACIAIPSTSSSSPAARPVTQAYTMSSTASWPKVSSAKASPSRAGS
ncbi:hypothetical protein K437DRAFT_101008 [Tilletiaria anomala UBC 951]|uniref:Uncharacterized protein n=1 Tax=Tilletiaria anomala (strain ATCC 24038 / CBS 436.72 / UBC 951) TaxID=1037660 RepID=A0A066W7U6_TILAU|nr:uncharacterized protein K437DRAFT_101008 [Tilletiaria anomala UBC 951]KDN47159.1 hypothetical protein K437DRAFT_101008 [Tilletiaria anomala UBC 951]